MYQVLKRTGETVAFDIKKIENAIVRAFVATNKNYNEDVIQMLALRASARFSDKVKDDKVSIEDIQDSVELILAQAGYEDVAKAYILYRKQHENVRQASKTLVDYKKLIDSYLGAKDWRVKENSTVNYSIGGLIRSNSGAVTANSWLSEIYDKEIGDAHRNADLPQQYP